MRATDPFYLSPEWRSTRALILDRDMHRCTERGCNTRASHVDHIVARAKGGAPYDPHNLRSLCHGCHSRKTARLDGGFGNRTATDWGCDAAGFPRDASHHWSARTKPRPTHGG